MAEQLAFWHLLSGGSAQPRHRPEVAAPAAPEPPEVPKASKAARAKPPAKPSKRAVRTCLACTKPFNSAGPHNRRCAGCRRHDAFSDGSPTEYSVQF